MTGLEENLPWEIVSAAGLRCYCINFWLFQAQTGRVLPSRDNRTHSFASGSLDIYSTAEGKTHMVPVGETPTYVNTQPVPPQVWPAATSSTESSPRKDLFDMSRHPSLFLYCLFFQYPYHY
jgi:hypothetical protein